MDRIKAFWAALGPMGKILLVGIPLLILLGLGLTLSTCRRGQTEQLDEEPAGEAAVLDGSATDTPANMGMLLPTIGATAPTGACLQIPIELPARYQKLLDAGWVPSGRIPANFCYTGAEVSGTMAMFPNRLMDGNNPLFWGGAILTERDMVIGTHTLPPGPATICVTGTNQCVSVTVATTGPCGPTCPGNVVPEYQDASFIATPAVFYSLGLSNNRPSVTATSLVPPQ